MSAEESDVDADIKINITDASDAPTASSPQPSSRGHGHGSFGEREDSLEAPSAGRDEPHEEAEEKNGDKVELMPSATPRSTDGGIRQPRVDRLRYTNIINLYA